MRSYIAIFTYSHSRHFVDDADAAVRAIIISLPMARRQLHRALVGRAELPRR